MSEEKKKNVDGSEFNEAAAQIRRIDFLKQRRSYFIQEGDLAMAQRICNDIFDQLSYDALLLDGFDTEKNKYFIEDKKINYKLMTKKGIIHKGLALREYCQFLEKLQGLADKGGKYYDPSKDGMRG